MSNNHNSESRAPIPPKIVDNKILQPIVFGGTNFGAFQNWMEKATSSDAWIAQQAAIKRADPFRNPIPAELAAMKTAQLGRPCVVENMYYRDVGHIVAPGGVGKTTLLLYHAIQIVIGDDIHGNEVRMPGPVVYISAEDDSDSLLARLWQMCKHLEHEEQGRHDLDVIARDLYVIDAAGHGDIKLTTDVRASRHGGPSGGIVQTDRLGTLIETLKAIGPVMVFIDPLVSFGVGESKVNDAEQAMIEVARRIVKQVRCGVIFVHHSGKALIREGEAKQYSGRGGSALADGSRMVFTLENVPPDEWLKATGENLGDGESGLLFSRPKLTWCKSQPPIYLKRNGFQFFECDHIGGTEGAQVRLENDALKIEQFLREEWLAGRKYTAKTLEATEVVKPRQPLRAAVAHMIVQGKVVEEDAPTGGRGRPPKLLRPRDG